MRVKVTGTRQASSGLSQLFQLGRRGHAPEVVKRSERPYWQERGWVRQGDRYIGTYQTRYGSFRGIVEQRGGSFFRFYILDPPGELRDHSHWACFQKRENNWYEVHMGKMPADVSSGILTIERLISEAFQG